MFYVNAVGVFMLMTIVMLSGISFGEEPFRYDAKGKRDPFIPLVSKGGVHVSDAYGIRSIKDVRLEGIVWDEAKGSVAIVNGMIAGEDEEVGAVKVIKIEKTAVIFEFDGEETRIELISEDKLD